MPVHPLRTHDAQPTLPELVEDPARVRELDLPACTGLVVQLAGLIAALGARQVEAAKPAPELRPPLDVKTAAPLLGMSADTLARRAKSDPAYRALTFDAGTDRLLFDLDAIEKFRKRRLGA